ncbi:MAG: hypothetical protein OEL91_07230, partial [Burkholderiaceae bacterium]|nr:hypothetical protein [Burkholderiaceae bacterium]
KPIHSRRVALFGTWTVFKVAHASSVRRHSSAAARKYRGMMKVMNSASWQGANRSDTRTYREDLQRRHGVEGALSWFDIFESQH